jgi:hypothetical protein
MSFFHSGRFCAFAVLVVSLALAGPIARAASPKNPADVAKAVDVALTAGKEKATLPAIADDVTFLRRVSLDLTGKVPGPAEISAFVQDSAPDRRARLVEKLLASDQYAINWGRYWRDVLTYHTPASANYLRWQLFDQWIVKEVRRNRPWSEIVSSLVTASGVNDETGPVNFLTAHFGNPIEIAATTSRVFLGVQLQCAQCHDAKTDAWKREQFHELVAFFGRAKLIQRKDVSGRGTPYAMESRDEGQYQMPNQKDPNKLHTMTPRFLTGEAVALDATDQERREALAKMITSPKNPWFARTYVNRMWASLMGWGFYPGLSDLGSDEEPRQAAVLDLLAREWTASGYDMKWLFRTLTATEAYQRRLQPRPENDAPAPPAVCPSRLRPEQIFEALVKALGFDENDRTLPAPAPSSAPAVQRHTGLRNMIYQAFKVDPSLPAQEVQGTIPQALLFMNSVVVNTYVASKGKTFLAEALQKDMKDDAIVTALYERTLARPPRFEELNRCRSYLVEVNNRQEAFEDIFWSLINSTEFLTKR